MNPKKYYRPSCANRIRLPEPSTTDLRTIKNKRKWRRAAPNKRKRQWVAPAASRWALVAVWVIESSFHPHSPPSPRHRKRWQEHPTAENALRRKCQPKDWQKIARAEKMLNC